MITSKITKETNIIKDTFQEIADIVTPTMGAKGCLAVIQSEMGHPILTDDGVTVAKSLRYEGMKSIVASSMIEAAHNTEKIAYDGTTLTVLLTNELYKVGVKLIEAGLHPQNVAQIIEGECKYILSHMKPMDIEFNAERAQSLALLTTKMPAVAALVAEAYNHSNQLNVMIEMERVEPLHSVEHTDGMLLTEGYYVDSFTALCNSGNTTDFLNARIVLLAEGMMTQNDLIQFFNSIPGSNIKDNFVFVIAKTFNPESLKMLLDMLVQNQMKFQFIFINEANPNEIFLDLAAYTGGSIQDASRGTTNYKFQNAGFTPHIVIKKNETIISKNNLKDVSEAINQRLEEYNKENSEYKYNLSQTRQYTITQRIANLTGGVTKIKLALPTITEFSTIRLKVDDGVGAVRCAIKNGLVLGGGKYLYDWAKDSNIIVIEKALRAPLETITKNAGLAIEELEVGLIGYNVNTGAKANLVEEGILDSFDSIYHAFNNASSIACNYLKAFIIIQKD
jgi:chaperonin GroEL